MRKTYLAVVEGEPRRRDGVIRNFLIGGARISGSERRLASGRGRKEAITRHRVVTVAQRPVAGRGGTGDGAEHEIRVHLAGLGCPVAGDPVYGAKPIRSAGWALHAWRLTFDHPATGQRVELESPLPEVLRVV